MSAVDVSDPSDAARRRRQMAVLNRQIRACDKCPGLNKAGDTEAVIASGPATATVVMVGESPAAKCMGAVPFTGGSGRILDSALARAGHASRDHVFITNTIHCHPPEDRDPLPAEITNCRRYLSRELDVVRPRLVIGLGKYAEAALRSIYPDAVELTAPFRLPRAPGPGAAAPRCLLLPHPYWIMTRAGPMREDYEAALASALRWGFRGHPGVPR